MRKIRPFYLIFIFSSFFYIIKSSTEEATFYNDVFIKCKIKSYTNLRDTHPKLAIKKFIILRNKLKKTKPNYYKEITYQLIYIYTNSLHDFNKAIEESKLGERAAKQTNDFYYLSEMYQVRGISHIEIGFSEKGFSELNTALKYAKKAPNSPDKQISLAIIYDNIGGYYETRGEYNNYIKYKKQSLSEAKKIKEIDKFYKKNKYAIIASQYINLGNIHFSKNNLDSPQFYFNESYNVINRYKNVIPFRIQADIYNRISLFYFEKKDFENSIKYAHKGISLLNKSPNSEIKRHFYKTLYLSYIENNKIDSSKIYSDLFFSLNDSITTANKVSTNSEMINILNENKSYYYKIFIIIFIVLLIIIFFIVYIQTIKFKKRYIILLNKINNEEKRETLQENSILKSTTLITDKTKNILLKKFEKFEKSNKFTKKGLTINTLAHQMNTNTTYLSTVIKEEKNKNFNGYINELRIKYIVNLLRKEPQYREYKTSYLADICGFSSREVFATIFKKETGITPSYFIKKLNQEDVN